MAAPSSALPIGSTSSLDDMALVKIDVGDVLLHTVLCVSNADLDHDAATAALPPRQADARCTVRASSLLEAF